ncbi:RNase H family protein [Vibrio breoganii]
MEKVRIGEVISNYKGSTNQALNRGVFVGRKQQISKKAPLVTLYTDGASYGGGGNRKGIGGSGYILDSLHSEPVYGYAGHLNVTPLQAEFAAIINGLKAIKEPCNVHIVTDSLYACELLDNLERSIRICESVEQGGDSAWQELDPKQMTKAVVGNELRAISEIMENNNKIGLLKIRYVRAHCIDSFRNRDIQANVNISREAKPSLAAILMRNAQADMLAQRGVEKVVSEYVAQIAKGGLASLSPEVENRLQTMLAKSAHIDSVFKREAIKVGCGKIKESDFDRIMSPSQKDELYRSEEEYMNQLIIKGLMAAERKLSELFGGTDKELMLNGSKVTAYTNINDLLHKNRELAANKSRGRYKKSAERGAEHQYG